MYPCVVCVCVWAEEIPCSKNIFCKAKIVPLNNWTDSLSRVQRLQEIVSPVSCGIVWACSRCNSLTCFLPCIFVRPKLSLALHIHQSGSWKVNTASSLTHEVSKPNFLNLVSWTHLEEVPLSAILYSRLHGSAVKARKRYVELTWYRIESRWWTQGYPQPFLQRWGAVARARLVWALLR